MWGGGGGGPLGSYHEADRLPLLKNDPANVKLNGPIRSFGSTACFPSPRAVAVAPRFRTITPVRLGVFNRLKAPAI